MTELEERWLRQNAASAVIAFCCAMPQTRAERVALAATTGVPCEDEHEICAGCGRECDPNTCWCGNGMHYFVEHPFIPMGCTCGYHDAEERRLC